MAWRWTAIGLTAALTGGCAVGRGPLTLETDDPAVKVPAMEKSVRTKHLKSQVQLIDNLESDDAAIRLFAIESLERMTGQTLGYKYYDNEHSRAQAVTRWRQFVIIEAAGGTTLPTTLPSPGQESTPAAGATQPSVAEDFR